MCKRKHTYKKTEGSGHTDWPSQRLSTCPQFGKLTAVDHGKKIQELNACPRCTSWLHQAENCRRQTGPICNRTFNGARCQRMHADILHDSQNSYCEANVVVLTAKGTRCGNAKTVLLEIQEVVIRASLNAIITALLFWDPGATLSLCTHIWASKHCLTSRPCTVYLKVVNKAHEKVRTREYQFWLVNNDNKEHEIWAVGLDNITDEIEQCSYEPLYD